MKKILFMILLIIVVGITVTVVYNNNFSNMNNTDDNNVDDVIKEDEEEEIEESYIDDNPIKISIYSKNNNEWKIASNISTTWGVEKVFGNLDTYLTDESFITTNNYKNTWLEYFNKYEDISEYKIGYNIKFTMKDGTTIDKLILSPKDTDELFSKIMIYLYDDINVVDGSFYSHMEENQMTDKTILSSIKLVGGSEINDIESSVELSAFTYNSEDDFDNITGKYKGKSYYTTIINRGV